MVDETPRSRAMKIFLGVGYALFALFTLLVIIGLWFGDASETFVQAGNRLPQKFVKMARDVGALGRGEKEREADHARQMKAPAEAESPQ